ncbi:hypothetical protein CKA32_005587 [Geitlerinema sp. FC II]|nr:hypothetical protein CKA32_005587 [Geitlerinema sp. FC II]
MGFSTYKAASIACWTKFQSLEGIFGFFNANYPGKATAQPRSFQSLEGIFGFFNLEGFLGGKVDNVSIPRRDFWVFQRPLDK